MLFSTQSAILALTALLSTTLAAPPPGWVPPVGAPRSPPPQANTTLTSSGSAVTVNTTTVGVYTCSSSDWTGGCAWEDTSGMPRCRMIPWTDEISHTPGEKLARVSIGPDRGNNCILYEDSRCGRPENSYLLRHPGTTDMYEWAKGQGLSEDQQGLFSMLCLGDSLIKHYYKGKGADEL